MNIRHRRWVRQANGPLPDPLPPVKKGCCPTYRRYCLSCCNHPHAIWLNRWDWKHRPTLYHELGHWFDFQYLSDVEREQIRARYGWPRMAWWYEDDPEHSPVDPNCERFARVYTRMLLHPSKFRWLRQKLRACKEHV